MEQLDPSSGRFQRAGRLPYTLAVAGVVQCGYVAYQLGGESLALTKHSRAGQRFNRARPLT
jgi:hypothetical protein